VFGRAIEGIIGTTSRAASRSRSLRQANDDARPNGDPTATTCNGKPCRFTLEGSVPERRGRYRIAPSTELPGRFVVDTGWPDAEVSFKSPHRRQRLLDGIIELTQQTAGTSPESAGGHRRPKPGRRPHRPLSIAGIIVDRPFAELSRTRSGTRTRPESQASSSATLKAVRGDFDYAHQRCGWLFPLTRANARSSRRP